MLTDNGWLVGGHSLLADKKWLAGWGAMVCWLARSGWMVGGDGLLADKKWLGWLGPMVC